MKDSKVVKVGTRLKYKVGRKESIDCKIVDSEKKYVPVLGDIVKIKIDIYSKGFVGMLGQVVLMFHNGKSISLLLMLEKNYGWNIENNKDNLPSSFYSRYSQNKNCGFWWVDLDKVEFVRHSKVVLDN